MAAQVLDYPVFSTALWTNDDLSKAMSSSLRNVQHLMNLLVQKQSPQEQEAYARSRGTASVDCKKFITLIGRLGHARYRRPPGERPSASSPPALFQMLPASSPGLQSSSPSALKDVEQPQIRLSVLHDATQAECVQDKVFFQPDLKLAGSPHDKAGISDEDAHHGAVSLALGADIHFSHRCNAGKLREKDAYGIVYDATTPLVLQRHGHPTSRPSMPAQKEQSQPRITISSSPTPCPDPDRVVSAPLKTSSSFVSSLSIEERGGGTVSSGKPLFSGRPPLPPKRRKILEQSEKTAKKCQKLEQCHCSRKRRKLHRETQVRIVTVPTDEVHSEAEAPDDGYSWCIYGQKFVDGSAHPRTYYKCNSVTDCPARKHVQRASRDEAILIVTYGRRHAHPQILKTGKA